MSLPYTSPVTQSRPERAVLAVVYNAANALPLAALPDVTADEGLRWRVGTGATERLELTLPRRLGLADIANELYSTGALALDNYLRIYAADWRTLGRGQADASVPRTGSTEADLSRLLWTGIIRVIAARPAGITVTAVEAAAGTATGTPVVHRISAAALLDYNLELSDYRLPGTVDYTGWIEVSHEAYDTHGIALGDTVTVLEDRAFNPDSNTRYNAYGDNPRTVYALEWTGRGLTIQFDARTPDLVNDQLLKLTEMTRSATTNTVTASDQFVAAGGLTTKTVSGAPTDGSVGTPTDGTLLLDESTDRLYLRSNGVWKYVTLT